MKNKNIVSYIIVAVISFVLGFGLLYLLIHYFPNTVIQTISTEEKIVNVVDDGISAGISNIYDSVVVIESYKGESLGTSGSGFAYKTKDNYTYIITNNHVISGYNKIIVTLSNDEEMEASIVGADEFSDIAVLKVKNNKNLKIAKLGNTKDINIGDTVFALGAPLGKTYKNTATRGILSGKDRLVESNNIMMNVMQTDASINPGNSGGPLCNASGNVIGVTSMKIVESSVEGFGFAIQIEDALNYADSIVEKGKVIRGYLGVQMADTNQTWQLYQMGIILDKKSPEGVVIVSVVDNSPASKANLKSGDIITKIGKNKVSNISELRYYLYKEEIGSIIDVTVYRSGKTSTMKVEVGEAD